MFLVTNENMGLCLYIHVVLSSFGQANQLTTVPHLFFIGLKKYECLWQALLLMVRHKKYRFICADKLTDFIFHRNSTFDICVDRSSTVNVCVEDIVTSLVAQQIFDSQGWKDKQVKMEEREEATMT